VGEKEREGEQLMVTIFLSALIVTGTFVSAVIVAGDQYAEIVTLDCSQWQDDGCLINESRTRYLPKRDLLLKLIR